jgi:hypothetical protein
VRRFGNMANLALFLIGLMAIVVVINFFARRENWRERIDATKTRAYSLSDQSRQLLSSLQGNWKIALVMDQRRTDRAMRKQIDEVLSRYINASSNISVVKIDPSDPATMIEYDALLAELTAVYKDEVAAYDAALDAGAKAFAEAMTLAQQQGGVLEQLATMLPQDDPTREPLRQRINALLLLADQGNQIMETVERARGADASRPLPDYETARSTLVAALSQTAADLDELAQVFSKWLERPNLEANAKQFATAAQRECSAISRRLAEAADSLKHLPPLELSTIGTQVQQSELAIIIGPDRAAAIPSSQLFPKSNLKARDDGGVTFDQRFRGEQLISSTIRSLTVDHMPLVVFVHAEENTLLKPQPKQADVVGVMNMLKASRFEVGEWMVGARSSKPSGAKGQSTVWLIIPPPPARTLEATPPLRALIDTAQQLIADGEAVLLSVSPSLLAKYGQPDPFARMGLPFGVEAITSELIVERVTGATGQTQPTLGQAVHEFSSEHLIGRALNGLQTYFGTPVPLRVVEVEGGVRAHAIAAIQPSPERWLERDWTDIGRRARDPMQAMTEAAPMVVAAERIHPITGRPQRFMMVGSGGWMVSNVADVVLEIGGGRVALINPGNHELMLASAAWLAGMDELIAASPISQEVARLGDVTSEARLRWMWITVAGLPGACAALGVLVWMMRRN